MMLSENKKRERKGDLSQLTDTDSEYQHSVKHADQFNSELDSMIAFIM